MARYVRKVIRWVPCFGHESTHDVSDLGQIRNRRTGDVLPIQTTGGYHRVSICGARRKLHVLVLRSFRTRTKAKPNALHCNGNRADNRLINLRWGTQRDNYEDARRHGTAPIGEQHGQAKLTRLQAEAIRMSVDPGVMLAQRYGVCAQTICDIRSGRCWHGSTTN